MNRIFVVLLALLALGLGAVAIASHRRACKAEKALAELRNSMASTCGDRPQKNGDSPRKAGQQGGDSPQKSAPKCGDSPHKSIDSLGSDLVQYPAKGGLKNWGHSLHENEI